MGPRGVGRVAAEHLPSLLAGQQGLETCREAVPTRDRGLSVGTDPRERCAWLAKHRARGSAVRWPRASPPPHRGRCWSPGVSWQAQARGDPWGDRRAPLTPSLQPVGSVSSEQVPGLQNVPGEGVGMEGTVGTQPRQDRAHKCENACCSLEPGLILGSSSLPEARSRRPSSPGLTLPRGEMS